MLTIFVWAQPNNAMNNDDNDNIKIITDIVVGFGLGMQ